LIDTGTSDEWEHFLESKKLRDTVAEAGLNVNFRFQGGYDHSYNFISSFMKDHIDFHAMWLKTKQRN